MSNHSEFYIIWKTTSVVSTLRKTPLQHLDIWHLGISFFFIPVVKLLWDISRPKTPNPAKKCSSLNNLCRFKGMKMSRRLELSVSRHPQVILHLLKEKAFEQEQIVTFFHPKKNKKNPGFLQIAGFHPTKAKCGPWKAIIRPLVWLCGSLWRSCRAFRWEVIWGLLCHQ